MLKHSESCGSGRGQTPFSISSPSAPIPPQTPLSLAQILQPAPTPAPWRLSSSSSSSSPGWASDVRATATDAAVDMRSRGGDWLALRPTAFLPAESPSPVIPPLVLSDECYCVVKALPFPPSSIARTTRFKFSYTAPVESAALPPLWTRRFPRLTCLEAAVEMSCRPSHGVDPTFTLIADKKKTKKMTRGRDRTTDFLSPR